MQTAPVELGYAPLPLLLKLTNNGFTATLKTVDHSDWPAGTQVVLVLGDPSSPAATWPATVAGDTISWSRTAADVADLPEVLAAQMTYSDNDIALLDWMIGNVVWYGR